MIPSFASFVLTALSVTAVYGAPTTHRRLTVRQVEGEVVPDEYIVKLKSGATTDAHIAGLPFAFSVSDILSPVTEVFEDIFKGYAGKFVGADLDAILASPDVEYVEPNMIMHIFETQDNAPWGLESTSSDAPVGSTDAAALSYTYGYDTPAGEGVDIYIIDTGVYTQHSEFEGRATFGFAAGSLPKADGHGHGTHCAGTAAGKTYGVAKNANVIGVKVLADSGSGSTADIVAGIQWSFTNAKSTGRPSIGSMSLGGAPSQAIDDAVATAIAGGMQFAVAAGNSNLDAGNTSPARSPTALTVGATTISNEKANFSNFGNVVDIWAPGQSIISSWIGNPSATNNISGTSMATPHIAGLLAYFLGHEPSLTPAALVEKTKSLAKSGVITGVPSGTVNLLAFNGFGGSSDPAPSSTSPIVPVPTTLPPSEPPTRANNCPTWWPNCPWKNWF